MANNAIFIGLSLYLLNQNELHLIKPAPAVKFVTRNQKPETRNLKPIFGESAQNNATFNELTKQLCIFLFQIGFACAILPTNPLSFPKGT